VEVPAGRSAGVAGACVPETDPGGDDGGGDDGEGGAVSPCVGDGGVGVPLGNRARGGIGASRAKGSGSAVGTGRLGGDDGEGGEEHGGSVDGDEERPSAVAGSNRSGESGSEGFVGGVGIGDNASDIGGEVLKGWSRGGRTVYLEGVICRVDGGVAGGGLAGPDGDSGDRMISFSSSESRRSFSSLRRRLVLFEGGG
jgi:hypothetical protein